MTQKQICAGLAQNGQYQTNVAFDDQTSGIRAQVAMGRAWMSPGKGRALKDSG